MLVKLPNGLLDGSDHFQYADVDELRGKQQNYLANQELVVGNIGHIPKILEDMILSIQTKTGLEWQGNIKDAIWKLPSGDLETILIKVRENTYGGKFYHGAQCTHCQHEMKDLLLHIDKLEIEELPLEEQLKKKNIELPKSKMTAEVRPAYLRDLFTMIKVTTDQQDKLITELVALSLASLHSSSDDKVVSPVKGSDIENLPVSDLIHLQEELEKIKTEGSIDTDIEIECENCRKDFSIKLNVFDPSFFDPTKGSTPGNM